MICRHKNPVPGTRCWVADQGWGQVLKDEVVKRDEQVGRVQVHAEGGGCGTVGGSGVPGSSNSANVSVFWVVLWQTTLRWKRMNLTGNGAETIFQRELPLDTVVKVYANLKAGP